MPNRRRIKGDRAFKRLINRLPGQVRQEIVGQMQVTGTQILAQQRANAPFKTGQIKSALSMRVLKGTLKLKVGLLGKQINRRLWYARVIERGRKAQTVQVRRASSRPYTLQVSPLRPRPFIYNFKREQLYAPFKKIWDRALQKAASGISDV